MSGNYNGLTKNTWPGTWAPNSNAPIAIDTDLRGTLQSISGTVGDYLTNISGQRLTEGMLVYLQNGYTAGSFVRSGDTYYKYVSQTGEVRDFATGALPNSEINWIETNLGSGQIISFPAFGYVHTQISSVNQWVIQHNQNTTSLICQIYTTAREHIFPDSTIIDDANQITVTFTTPMSGFAHLILFKPA
jgi:hypothetical protein